MTRQNCFCIERFNMNKYCEYLNSNLQCYFLVYFAFYLLSFLRLLFWPILKTNLPRQHWLFVHFVFCLLLRRLSKKLLANLQFRGGAISLFNRYHQSHHVGVESGPQSAAAGQRYGAVLCGRGRPKEHARADALCSYSDSPPLFSAYRLKRFVIYLSAQCVRRFRTCCRTCRTSSSRCPTRSSPASMTWVTE